MPPRCNDPDHKAGRTKYGTCIDCKRLANLRYKAKKKAMRKTNNLLAVKW